MTLGQLDEGWLAIFRFFLGEMLRTTTHFSASKAGVIYHFQLSVEPVLFVCGPWCNSWG